MADNENQSAADSGEPDRQNADASPEALHAEEHDQDNSGAEQEPADEEQATAATEPGDDLQRVEEQPEECVDKQSEEQIEGEQASNGVAAPEQSEKQTGAQAGEQDREPAEEQNQTADEGELKGQPVGQQREQTELLVEEQTQGEDKPEGEEEMTSAAAAETVDAGHTVAKPETDSARGTPQIESQDQQQDLQLETSETAEQQQQNASDSLRDAEQAASPLPQSPGQERDVQTLSCSPDLQQNQPEEPMQAVPSQSMESQGSDQAEVTTPGDGKTETTAQMLTHIVPPPPPPIADGMSDTMSTAEERACPNALNLSWSFGINKNVPVINMTDENRQMVMYCCAHTGILYDFRNNKQILLQGHANAISCTCVSGDKRWLATADKGNDSLVIIWDSHSGIPVRTMFDAHPDGGVAAMAMTADAKYLVTISAAEKQTIAVWDWTVEGEVPMCTAELDPSYGQQTFVYFNPEDTTQIVTNSETQVIFYSWKGGILEYFAPPLSDEDFNKPVGKFSQSIFLSNSTRALTATSLGNLVVWETNKPLTKVVSNEITPDKKALKLVKLQERGITVLTTTDKHLVMGDVLGHIKFFDQSLKLLCWYQDFHLGPITALTFAHDPHFALEDAKTGDFPADATIPARPFGLCNFVVGTSNAVIAHVNTDGTDVSVIHKDHDSAVHALSSHPSKPWIAVGSYSGCLKIWDYEEKETVIARFFDKGLMIRCCTFDPKGTFLAVGFLNGMVRVLDVPSLNDALKEPFRFARDAVTHLAFSHDCQYLAVADAEFTTSIFRHEKSRDGEPFVYFGRHRAHYKLIADILFGVQLDSDQPRLLSLGEDRVLVEYDLANSCTDRLVILSSDRIEQSGVALCMEWYPPVTKESFILTANDQFKFKLYNSTTKMCRKTLLGPTYGSPLQKVVMIPAADPVQDKRYMGYITSDKIGLHILPLDGNPHNSMALIAHPQGAVNLVSSYDGKYLFTAGGVDSTVHMWNININVLEAQSKLGGEDLVPFYGLLDGGRGGELFKELEDLFYYAQIRSQGVNTMKTRQIGTTIPISEIPFVMRALGFYPSEQEVEDMLNEIKYSTYVETGEYTRVIDLGDFIKLYTNHRPAFGLQPEKLQWAFEVLGYPSEEGRGSGMDRGDLLEVLQNKGEHMTEYELAEYLTTLLGFNPEGGSSELQEFDPTTAGEIIDDNLPHEVTADIFSNDLLGFSMYSDVLAVNQGEEGQVVERRSQVVFTSAE